MKPTIQEVIELARFEFRRYGFRADGGKSDKVHETVRITFDQEPATGQAAFTQYTVTPYVRIWCDAHDEDGQYVVKSDAEEIGLDLCVSYVHVSGGGNGFNVPYTLKLTHFDGATLRRTSAH